MRITAPARREHVDTPHPHYHVPALTPDDGDHPVRFVHQVGLVLGSDLLLYTERDTNRTATGYEVRISACDSDGNHLATLGVVPITHGHDEPAPELLAGALATAERAALRLFPAHLHMTRVTADGRPVED